jgi:hypothetical protein
MVEAQKEEGEGEKQISPDDKLKILLKSELFKINNFTRIFEILHRVPAAPAPAPAPIPAPAPAKPAPAPAKPAAPTPAAPVATQQDNILFTINKDELIINGGNLQQEIVDDYFTDIKDSLTQTTYDEIKSNIICSDIINAIDNTTVILDPANFDSIRSNLAGGYLSGLIYKLINDNEKAHVPPLTDATKVEDLFTSQYNNAFYKTYTTTIDISKNIHIIHSVGPDFITNIEFKDTYLNYKTFNKIYSDIYNAYINIHDHNITNLLLVCISSGIFASNGNIDYSTEVLTLIAAKFIKLFIINKKDNTNKNIKMYIYNPNFKDNMCKYHNIFLYQVKRIFRLITTTIT